MEMNQDIDLYAEVDDFGQQESEYNNNEGADLYDDVLAPSERRESDAGNSDQGAGSGGENSDWKGAEGDHQESGHSGPTGTVSVPLGPDGRPERRHGLYIGNLTWWTTDQDITDALNGLGVNDITDIRFFENRANGQSKGFCVVNMNSETSWKKVMEELPKMELHGQNPAVTHCNKQTLNYFEVQSRKMNPNAPGNNSSSNNGTNNGSSYGDRGAGSGYQSGHPGSGSAPRWPPSGVRGPLIPRPPRPDGSTGLMGSRPPMYPGSGYQGGWRPRAPPQGGPPPGHGYPPASHGPPGMGGPRPPMMRPRGPPPHGQPLLRAPGPPPSMDPNRGGYDSWDSHHHSNHQPGSTSHMSASGPIHVNPNFFPNRDSGYDRGHGSDRSLGYHGDGDRDRRGGYDRPSVSDAEFDEIMHKNRSVCDTSTERAIAAAGAGDYTVAIETLETAISIIQKSKISHDERCKVLVSSLEDTLHGIASKSSRGSGSNHYHSSRPRSRSPMRSSSRRTRSRSKGRSSKRSRSRDRDRYHHDERDSRKGSSSHRDHRRH